MDGINPNDIKKIIYLGLGAGVIILLILFWPFVTIGAGERGVVMNFGKVSEHILGEGIHPVVPVMTSVRKISVKVQKEDIKAEAASKDLQDVNMDIVVNYHIDATKVNKVYQEIGDNKDVFERIVVPNTNEVVKAATSKYTVQEVIEKRQILKQDIDALLIERIQTYGVVLDDVSLVNVDFSEQFNAAIEAKQVAEQQSQQARFLADKAKNEADAAINKAKGEAEAQRLQQQTLTQDLLQKLAIEKWDGKFPQYYGGNVLPFININK